MFTQSKKKIYIIGSNPDDFFDLTVQSLKILSKSHLIIISKRYNKQYFEILKRNKKEVFIEDEISTSQRKLFDLILLFFKKYHIISHLITGDTFMFSENKEELFFKKKKIKTQKILGIPALVNYVNKKKSFLTDRNKNSSVTFFSPLSKSDCFKLNKLMDFEKIIIKITRKIIFSIILELIESKNFQIFKCRVFLNTKEVKNIRRINFNDSCDCIYIILENDKV